MESFKSFLNKKTKTVEDLAKKHKVSIDEIKHELEIGIKVESEHTTHENVARQIALNHLDEDPKYYSKLKRMEKKK